MKYNRKYYQTRLVSLSLQSAKEEDPNVLNKFARAAYDAAQRAKTRKFKILPKRFKELVSAIRIKIGNLKSKYKY